ncbi:SRPBCC family protein [Thetidibacter halocola]|uniref:SRPBCC family protein n=1 Tax=Thetidibacter halocola TaxID=2827239 RepID=A0A8J7WEN2_9RHOB|nr:SRPBCC family protein [Thetidibacter halocola]MBS0126220.1 SRPBCC family protein [Thetidibacter halocola]
MRAPEPDSDLDLNLDRVMTASAAALWRCWTEPELLKRWFCPLPWKVTHAEIDPRPGGRFNTRMEGPNGEAPANDVCQMDSKGCFLDIDPGRRLVFTDALREGWRPNATPFMTGIVTFAPDPDGGTRYRALVLHHDRETRIRHETMGFEEGWGTATDQLEALARSL